MFSILSDCFQRCVFLIFELQLAKSIYKNKLLMQNLKIIALIKTNAKIACDTATYSHLFKHI